MKPPSHVTTIALAAQELGVDEELLWDIQDGLDEYDGVVWIYDIDGKQTLAFTNFGMENLEADLTERMPGWKKPPRKS
jgi:hypothetical protein